jgi:hypothetical protein
LKPAFSNQNIAKFETQIMEDIIQKEILKILLKMDITYTASTIHAIHDGVEKCLIKR